MITISDQAQAGDTYTYQIELEGENIDPYAKLPGNVRFFGSITIIDLIQATASLDSGQGGNFTLNIEKLPDNNYRIADFFKSGHALNFAGNRRYDNHMRLWLSIRCILVFLRQKCRCLFTIQKHLYTYSRHIQ